MTPVVTATTPVATPTPAVTTVAAVPAAPVDIQQTRPLTVGMDLVQVVTYDATNNEAAQSACQGGNGGFSDIGVGTAVTVKDGKGAIIATGALSSATFAEYSRSLLDGIAFAGQSVTRTNAPAGAGSTVAALSAHRKAKAGAAAAVTIAAMVTLGFSPANAAGLPYGPGPQTHYTVQRQPAAGSCHYRWLNRAAGLVLPDPRCTPGALNPRVTQKTLVTTICHTGYTTTIRPSSYVTGLEKKANAASYAYTGSLATGEYDHFISLELGGDPNDARNLFVEPNRTGAKGVNNPKDPVENTLSRLVCNAVHLASHHAGTATSYLPLATAQQLLAANWTTAVTGATIRMVRG
jgi:hypothetical protein